MLECAIVLTRQVGYASFAIPHPLAQKETLNMMNGKFMALALAALAALSAVADEVEYGLVQFNAGPGTVNQHTGFNSPEDWIPQIAPNSAAAATNHYLMANKNSMRTWVSSMTFNGKSLTVGVVGGNSASIQECATAAGIVTTYANDGLIMANGSYWRPSSRNREGTIVGKMKVVSPASAPFTTLLSLNFCIARQTRLTIMNAGRMTPTVAATAPATPAAS